MTRHQLLYAWPSFRKALPLEVAVLTDGEPLAVKWIDVAHGRVNVAAGAKGWGVVDLELRLSADEDVPAGLDLDRITAHALLTAPGSVTRIPVMLDRDQSGHWAGVLRVTRDDVRGTAALTASLTVDSPSVAAQVVGSSDEWTIAFDTAPGPVGKGLSPLNIVWTSFGSPPAEMPQQLKGLRSSLSFCDTSQADPILYLNEDVKDLRSLLENEKATGLPGVARDTVGALIALDAVAALCDAAVSAVRRACEKDDDGSIVFQGLNNPVYEAVLSELVDHVDFATGYHDLCMLIARAEFADDLNEIVGMSSRLRASSQGIVAARKNTEDLVRKVLNG